MYKFAFGFSCIFTHNLVCRVSPLLILYPSAGAGLFRQLASDKNPFIAPNYYHPA